MPIDSICSGCGKMLRVADDFAGRKARCPICGVIYVVGDAGTQAAAVDSGNAETTYVQPIDSNSLQGMEPLASSESLSSPISSPIAPAPSRINDEFFVRTPNQSVYGPTDRQTVLDWIAQGRLDDSCHIRQSNSEQWIGLPAWRFQSKQQDPFANPFSVGAVGSAQNESLQFKPAPNSLNQSAGYARSGNGIVVLILGIGSWILCPTFLGALVCAIIAIALGLNELKRVRQGVSPASNRTPAMFGLWLGIINLVVLLGSIIAFVVIASMNP
jgi:hypothetical protein